MKLLLSVSMCVSCVTCFAQIYSGPSEPDRQTEIRGGAWNFKSGERGTELVCGSWSKDSDALFALATEPDGEKSISLTNLATAANEWRTKPLALDAGAYTLKYEVTSGTGARIVLVKRSPIVISDESDGRPSEWQERSIDFEVAAPGGYFISFRSGDVGEGCSVYWRKISLDHANAQIYSGPSDPDRQAEFRGGRWNFKTGKVGSELACGSWSQNSEALFAITTDPDGEKVISLTNLTTTANEWRTRNLDLEPGKYTLKYEVRTEGGMGSKVHVLDSTPERVLDEPSGVAGAFRGSVTPDKQAFAALLRGGALRKGELAVGLALEFGLLDVASPQNATIVERAFNEVRMLGAGPSKKTVTAYPQLIWPIPYCEAPAGLRRGLLEGDRTLASV